MLRVEFAPLAREQLRELLAWWRTNRPDAQPLPIELRRVLKLLAQQPQLGATYKHPSKRVLRVYRLRKTPYLLIYEVTADAIRIVAAWSGARGKAPPLGR